MTVSERTQSLIEFDNQIVSHKMDRLFEAFELAIAKMYLGTAIGDFQTKSEHKDHRNEHGNRVTLMLVDGQIGGYAEKYDEILRSMRHYG